MPGAPEPEYVLARKVLLDALEALGDQREAVVLVGAQTIYLHTGDAEQTGYRVEPLQSVSVLGCQLERCRLRREV